MAQVPPTLRPPRSVTVPPTVRRWLVPAAAALAVIGGGVAVGLVTSAVDDALPARSPEQLIADVLTASPEVLQGTVAIRVDLDLPPLPLPSVGSADLGSLVTGTHTLLVRYASPDQARLALLGRDAETDVIVNGTDLWVWSSHDNTAYHVTLPTGGALGDLLGGGLPVGGLAAVLGGGGFGGAVGPDGAPRLPLPTATGALGGLDPQVLARLALTFLEPYTEITTNNDASVAGRPAYELVLRPRDRASLIDSVVLAIDAEEHFPLRFAVLTSDGGAPAIEIRFTEVSFTRPDPGHFKPPQGAIVVEADHPADESGAEIPDILPAVPDLPGLPDPATGLPSGLPMPDLDPSGGGSPFSLVGEGWTTVVVVRVPEGFASDGPDEVLGLLPQVEGDWGSGRLLSTRLVSVLLTDDGRLIAGAVAPERLYEVAAGQ